MFVFIVVIKKMNGQISFIMKMGIPFYLNVPLKIFGCFILWSKLDKVMKLM